MARKKNNEAHHEEHADETWLIPYSDLLTLLLALFIVLFASSSLDKNKMGQMEYAFAAAFNAVPASELSGSILSLMEDLKELRLGDNVGLGSDAKGAVMDITGFTLFDEGSAEIREEGKDLLRKISSLLQTNKYKRYRVIVEGHTDDTPFSNNLYPSTWELSAARAGSVVREFIKYGDNPNRFQAVGMAGIAPKYPNTNAYGEPIPDNKIRNRRVAIRVEI